MARKSVLSGGKKDEIIEIAMQLFFKNGYEATSVRMILEQVGGEVGMFYHYFKSKEELFSCVTEYFFRNYSNKFIELTAKCDTLEQFIDTFLGFYQTSMEQFHSLSTTMHWTIQYAFAAKTIQELKPCFESLIEKWNCNYNEPSELVASQFLYGLSATLHSKSFEDMTVEQRKESLNRLVNKILVCGL